MPYMLYGLMLHAMPFIIGCTIAVSIHTYHIYRLKENKSSSTKEEALKKMFKGVSLDSLAVGESLWLQR